MREKKCGGNCAPGQLSEDNASLTQMKEGEKESWVDESAMQSKGNSASAMVATMCNLQTLDYFIIFPV